MKLLPVQEAVGQVLCHDITRIVPGVEKGPVFRKGHIIAPEDIPVLLSVGKDHIYVWETDETMYHEDEAAEILRDICMNEGMSASKPKEGKIELTAARDGLFLVNREKLRAINSLGRMMIATRPGGVAVRAGAKLCGTRIIPLVIEKAAMERAKEAAGPEPILSLKPIKPKKYGVVTTGNEVFYGRIQDTFTPVIEEKMAGFGCEMIGHEVSNDEHERIQPEIYDARDEARQQSDQHVEHDAAGVRPVQRVRRSGYFIVGDLRHPSFPLLLRYFLPRRRPRAPFPSLSARGELSFRVSRSVPKSALRGRRTNSIRSRYTNPRRTLPLRRNVYRTRRAR